MQKLIIQTSNSNKRIDKVLKDIYPHLPQSFMYKAFRQKDIKINGIRIKEDYITNTGDVVEVYIIDEILYGKSTAEHTDYSRAFCVVYEDQNILIVNKKQGIAVHPDKDTTQDTLIDLVSKYVQNKAQPPALCHRLDRNTGGLVVIAKNNEALKSMLQKIKNKEVKKYYQCIVAGKLQKPEATLKAYLEKDERKSRVFINDHKTKNSLEIITKYKTLSTTEILPDQTLSVLEVELVTGRTHQIRAHMAYIGHPIIGDGKYGSNTLNRSLKQKYQALWACRLKFDFSSDAGILNYLNGKEFKVSPDFKNIFPPR